MNAKQSTPVPSGASEHDRTWIESVVSGADHNPHGLLGPHPTKDGVVVRALRPLASSVTVVTADGRFPMEHVHEGVFGVLLPPGKTE